ncbi:hypothetical protein Tco_1382584 [Tanacetum coccineum]
MANVIPPDHVDDLPIVEPNQPDDVRVIPEPVLVNEDEDPEEKEFKKEGEPQEEEEDNMEVDIEEDKNDSELTYPYKDSDGLLPGLMRRDINSLFGRGFSSDDLCGSARRAMHRKKKGKAKTSIMSAPLTQAAVQQMIKESVDAAITACHTPPRQKHEA